MLVSRRVRLAVFSFALHMQKKCMLRPEKAGKIGLQHETNIQFGNISGSGGTLCAREKSG